VIPEEELTKIIGEVDKDKNGRIDYKEFILMMK
jgi:Ca2+-binding EF-hand superfamily protein